MLIITSPAKSQDYSPVKTAIPTTVPPFLSEATEVHALLEPYTAATLGKLMKISPKLAAKTHHALLNWVGKPESTTPKPALRAYVGDIYRAMQPETFDAKAQQYAQQYVRILTGLYGILRAYDGIEAYRLEMATPLAGKGFASLYAFWGDKITTFLKQEIATSKVPAVVDLASREYSKVVDFDQLSASLICPKFYRIKDGQRRIIGLIAKRARGLMIRYLATNQVVDPEQIKQFDLEGWQFEKIEGSDWDFVLED